MPYLHGPLLLPGNNHFLPAELLPRHTNRTAVLGRPLSGGIPFMPTHTTLPYARCVRCMRSLPVALPQLQPPPGCPRRGAPPLLQPAGASCYTSGPSVPAPAPPARPPAHPLQGKVPELRGSRAVRVVASRSQTLTAAVGESRGAPVLQELPGFGIPAALTRAPASTPGAPPWFGGAAPAACNGASDSTRRSPGLARAGSAARKNTELEAPALSAAPTPCPLVTVGCEAKGARHARPPSTLTGLTHPRLASQAADGRPRRAKRAGPCVAPCPQLPSHTLDRARLFGCAVRCPAAAPPPNPPASAPTPPPVSPRPLPLYVGCPLHTVRRLELVHPGGVMEKARRARHCAMPCAHLPPPPPPPPPHSLPTPHTRRASRTVNRLGRVCPGGTTSVCACFRIHISVKPPGCLRATRRVQVIGSRQHTPAALPPCVCACFRMHTSVKPPGVLGRPAVYRSWARDSIPWRHYLRVCARAFVCMCR